jgi:hypothetical protein
VAAPLHSITEPQPTSTGPKTLTGSQVIWEALANEGVKTVFGYPGGAIMPAYDALTDYPNVRHILVRHEQGAAHMATASRAPPARSAFASPRRDPAPPTW